MHESHVATCSGDGSIKLWDINLTVWISLLIPTSEVTPLQDYPIQSWSEHSREAYSIDWSNLQKELFVTSSWDATIKLVRSSSSATHRRAFLTRAQWTPERPTSIATIGLAHTGCVYRARFSPHDPNTIASTGADGRLHLFDIRTPTQPRLTIAAHATEALGLDWNKYASHEIATSSVDRSARIHDLRQPNSNAGKVLLGHGYAVRDVAFSPHRADRLATASYDMTVRVWDLSGPGAAPIRVHDAHSEFVVGVTWALFDEGVVASCGWDSEVMIWRGP